MDSLPNEALTRQTGSVFRAHRPQSFTSLSHSGILLQDQSVRWHGREGCAGWARRCPRHEDWGHTNLKMLRQLLVGCAAAALLLCLLPCACGVDQEDAARYFVFSFEGPTLGWSTGGVHLDNPAVVYNIQRAVDVARDSVSSAKFYLQNLNGRAKIWMERAFDVDSSADYEVTVQYSLATADWDGVAPWTILTGVGPRAVSTVDELGIQGTTANRSSSDVGFLWVSKRYTFDAHSSSAGKVYIHIGVWGTTVATRVYYVDSVYISLKRR